MRERQPWVWGVSASAFRAGYTVEWLKWEKSIG